MMILLFIAVSKKSYGIVAKNILCQIKNIQLQTCVLCSVFSYIYCFFFIMSFIKICFSNSFHVAFGEKDWPRKIEIDGNQLENVEKFTYLGCLNTYDLDSKKEILVRIA